MHHVNQNTCHKLTAQPINSSPFHYFPTRTDKSGKAVQLSYEDNLKLIAFTQQVAHGPLDTADAPPLGVFDVIGRNRRLAWQTLGALTRPQSQDGFVELLDRLCPSFKPYVEAIKQV